MNPEFWIQRNNLNPPVRRPTGGKPRMEFYGDLVEWNPWIYACPHDKHRFFSLSLNNLGQLYPKTFSCECSLMYKHYYKKFGTIPFSFWTQEQMVKVVDRPLLYRFSKELTLLLFSLLIGSTMSTAITLIYNALTPLAVNFKQMMLANATLALVFSSLFYLNPQNRLQRKVDWFLIEEEYSKKI